VLVCAQTRAAPFKEAIKDYWSKLKESRNEMDDLGRSLRKEKWDDLTYFLVQDACLRRLDKETSVVLMELALMGFVRATCARAGSMGKDWFDRTGLTLLSVGRNVLSIKDFSWDKDHFVIEVPEVARMCVLALARASSSSRCARAVCTRACAYIRGEVQRAASRCASART